MTEGKKEYRTKELIKKNKTPHMKNEERNNQLTKYMKKNTKIKRTKEKRKK